MAIARTVIHEIVLNMVSLSTGDEGLIEELRIE
jgi:hypothetical protein